MKQMVKRRAVLLLGVLTALILALSLPAAAETAGFTDVEADAWYAGAVRSCAERGLMTGTSTTRFDPEGTLTRAQLVTILWRQEGSPADSRPLPFSDVPEGKWYTEAVRWAAGEQLVIGRGDGSFGTEDAVTQEHLALIFRRFTDTDVTGDIPDFTGSAVPATRAQAAAALMACAQSRERQPAPSAGEGRILVAYFSNTGSTEHVASHLHDILGADLWKITPETPYTSADLNYSDAGSRASREQNDLSARPLAELLAERPLTIDMSDYAGMEKVGPLGTALPENDQEIATQAGDLILYQGDRFVIYYAPNTWNLTRLGRIDGVSAEELRELLGGGDVSVTLSLAR